MCLLESVCLSVLTKLCTSIQFIPNMVHVHFIEYNMQWVISTRKALDLKMSRSHEFCLLLGVELPCPTRPTRT